MGAIALGHLRGAVCLLSVPILAACAVPASAPGATPLDPTTAGHVAGVVWAAGGAGAEPSHTSRSAEPLPGVTVIAVRQGGDASGGYSASTGGDGTFLIDVPPGSYDVFALPPALSPRSQGIPSGLTPKTATITAGETVKIDFVFTAP